MKKAKKSIYQQAVDISSEFLGPSGERFMRRQIHTHLDKEPETLDEHDIERLTEWVKLTFALLTSDQQLVDSFAGKLGDLARPTISPKGGRRGARR